jgi:hypothetical protein
MRIISFVQICFDDDELNSIIEIQNIISQKEINTHYQREINPILWY